MDSKEIKAIANGLLDDEAQILAKMLAMREPQPLDGFADRASGKRFCPKCGVAMWKNGKSNGHQKWLCPVCRRTERSCSGCPAEGAKSRAMVWLKFVACELHRLTIREEAAECGVSQATAFYMRQKMQAALSEVLSRAELGGRVEMDGKFFRIGLKGSRAVPRKSKKRGTPAGKGEPQVVTIWAIDENDNMVAKIVGLGRESRETADKMLPHLAGCKTIVTDGRSCYEGFARDNGFRHVQIKSSGHSNEGGETMNEVNSLMSDFEMWSAHCRGISVRHLQGYIDRFLFQKMLGYAKEALDRPGAQIDAILSEKVVITCRDILKKAMPVDLAAAYPKDTKNDK